MLITFKDTAGSSCGALLPTGNAYDTIEGTRVTCIDNGMPTVLLRARDFDISGTETRVQMDANEAVEGAPGKDSSAGRLSDEPG